MCSIISDGSNFILSMYAAIYHKTMLSYINHTPISYFLSPCMYADINSIHIESQQPLAIIHILDNIVYTPGLYENLIDIPLIYYDDTNVLDKLIQAVGKEEYQLLLNRLLDINDDCGINQYVWHHASKHFTLSLKDHEDYPYLAHCLPYDPETYTVEDYHEINDESARYFLSHGIVDHVVCSSNSELSISVIQETLDYICDNPDVIVYDIDHFVKECHDIGCDMSRCDSLRGIVDTNLLDIVM